MQGHQRLKADSRQWEKGRWTQAEGLAVVPDLQETLASLWASVLGKSSDLGMLRKQSRRLPPGFSSSCSFFSVTLIWGCSH